MLFQKKGMTLSSQKIRLSFINQCSLSYSMSLTRLLSLSCSIFVTLTDRQKIYSALLRLDMFLSSPKTRLFFFLPCLQYAFSIQSRSICSAQGGPYLQSSSQYFNDNAKLYLPLQAEIVNCLSMLQSFTFTIPNRYYIVFLSFVLKQDF